ncbi:hypothetical protein Sfr7A_25295 [Streptomyces xinghaiensis]|nr:hypothetical protein Sfr7A_25295 [Streptomyces xinghaiensis]RNC70433.1 hypothetical protein DC095_024940 [Streptomyces xinghaiensis]
MTIPHKREGLMTEEPYANRQKRLAEQARQRRERTTEAEELRQRRQDEARQEAAESPPEQQHYAQLPGHSPTGIR